MKTSKLIRLALWFKIKIGPLTAALTEFRPNNDVTPSTYSKCQTDCVKVPVQNLVDFYDILIKQ